MFGQLRKNTFNNYITSLSFSFVNNIIQGDNLLFSPSKSYYLKFLKDQTETSVNIIIYLKNKTNDGIRQKIKEYNLNTDKAEIDFIFTPNQEYDSIYFEINNNSDAISINDLSVITNLLEPLKTSQLIKFGIQGPSGLLMSVNGEEIRIGRFGIYEPLSDIKVIYLGIVPKDSDFFILDYQY